MIVGMTAAASAGLMLASMVIMLEAMRFIAGNGAMDMMLRVAAFVIMVMVPVIMIMSMMPMCMMGVACLKIGPALGVKRRLDRTDFAAEALDHRLNDMIAADSEAPAGDLHGEMAVAEMPGEPQQMLGVFSADFAQGFGCPDNLDQTPVFQFHGVAGAQCNRLGQIEQERKPA